MAEGTVLGTTLAEAAFVILALLGPGLAALRLARARVDPALVMPLGLAVCAAFYWASLITHAPWLFPVLILAADAWALASWRSGALASGPSLRGSLPAFLALVAAFALTEFPMNCRGPRGGFIFDNVVPEDTTFHVGLAWELAAGYPPDVPGLSGVPMGYHLGLPLVRAAAIRWAGIHPYDTLSRFEITLVALGLILALRGLTLRLGGNPRALALVPWTLLATDFSFVFAWHPRAEIWLNLTDANLFFSIAHANSSVAALLLVVGSLLAYDRYRAGEGRGWLALAVFMGAAVPHFKVFVGAQFLLGLGVAALLTRRFREIAWLALPATAGLAAIVLGPASANMEAVLDPLKLVERLRHDLGAGAGGGFDLALWTLVWIVASLGLRALGLAPALAALGSASPPAVALAAMALSGWPLGLLFRVTPVEAPGRAPYNEAWYFIEQSAPLLWVFTVLALSRLRIRAAVLWPSFFALSLPSTLQFIEVKRSTPTMAASQAIVEAMEALARDGKPGDIVLERPEPRRYPPPPMVLIGRRIPYTRFIPYLYQTAPQPELRQRLQLVRLFFHTEDPGEALGIARSLDARYVCLYGGDTVSFPPEGVLRPVHEEANARVYAIVQGPGISGEGARTP